MSKYVLKDGAPEGVYENIGSVHHGEVVTPYSPEHEEALKADPRFKQYRGPAPGTEPISPVTTDATVEDAEADAPAKPATKAKKE